MDTGSDRKGRTPRCIEGFWPSTVRDDQAGEAVERTTRVWWRLLGVEHVVIESVDLESDGSRRRAVGGAGATKGGFSVAVLAV